MIEFEGQVVIVTGAGRGLGRLYAVELARRGASVVVNDLGGSMHGHGADTSVADQVVEGITRAGGAAVASHDSVDTPGGGEAIVRTAVDTFGRLDAVVSNAGIFNSVPFDELSAEDWRRMLRVHLDGGFYLSQPAYRVMKSQGYGRFVFISSSGGMFGQPLEAHYAAAKAGLVGLTNVIAIEGAEHGILANTVLPFGFSRMVTETVGDPNHLRAVAESNVGLSFSEDIETLGLVPPALVVVGAAEVDRHRCASGNRYLAELSVTGCLAHEVQQRGFPPDAFLDGLWEQAAVGADRRKLVGVSEQSECQARGRPRGSFGARWQKVAHEPEDLFVRQPHTVDFGLGQHADHVVAGIAPSLGKDADEVLAQLDGSGKRAIHVGPKPQEVDAQTVKLRYVRRRQAQKCGDHPYRDRHEHFGHQVRSLGVAQFLDSALDQRAD